MRGTSVEPRHPVKEIASSAAGRKAVKIARVVERMAWCGSRRDEARLDARRARIIEQVSR
jgi:hypothetical protein